MCLEKISISIYNIRKHHFQTITWANSRIFIFLLCAHQDSFEGEWVSEEFVGRGVKVTRQCAPPLQQGFCVTKNSTSLWLITIWRDGKIHVICNLCLVFGD